ncbi:MAG: DUF881 domain-containing protein [bacterium]|nr:DUF881 domain-containing protein [bacterium]
MNDFLTKKILFQWEIWLTCLILGIVFVWQINSRGVILNAQNPESQEVIAIEVARLTNANADLRRELADLSQQEFSLARAITDKSQAEESLQTKQEQADVLSGAVSVSGPGIRLVIQDDLNVPQLVDIVNALNNIGAEAIAINGKRSNNRFSFWRTDIKPPYSIEAIGSPAALSSALNRKGGILDQIEVNAGALDLTLTEHDKIVLPAVNVPGFVYARTVERTQK